MFGLVAYQLLAGPETAHDNAGTALMWVLWWPVLPVTFVLLGRFWCAVCPFGAICTARAACYNGTGAVPGCPLFTFPRTMDSNAACSLCAGCIKACPNDALRLRVRKPLSELWFIAKPKGEESFLAMAIMGIVFIQNLTMLTVWQDLLTWLETSLGITSYPVIFTLAFAVAVATPVGMLAVGSRVAGRANGESTWTNFARFGYALIPLDIAARLAHNLFHLLAEESLVWSTTASLVDVSVSGEAVPLASPSTILLLQLVIVALGVAGSGYTVWRIARSRFGATTTSRATRAPTWPCWPSSR